MILESCQLVSAGYSSVTILIVPQKRRGVGEFDADGTDEGRREGIPLGREDGIADGTDKGRREGIPLGREDGIADGANDGWSEGIPLGEEEKLGSRLVLGAKD